MTLSNRLAALFIRTFELPDDTVVEALTYRGIPEWDSLAHMRLIAAIETAFGVLLETEQILDLSSFQKAREILGQHGLSD
jgi:acyl carrier protein